MKKNWMLVTAFLIAGLLVIGCPSAPEAPGGRFIQGNITMVDGVYEHEFEFDEVAIEKDKSYLITIDVKDVDSTLWGCHFQAQLFYIDEDGTRFLLAGSRNAMPQNIAVKGKKYRITLTAGDYGTGDTAEDSQEKQDAGGYKIPEEATTPSGAVQIVRLTAKTPQWYTFGIRNQPNNGNTADRWDDIDYYDSPIESVIDGEITVAFKPSTVMEPGPVIALAKGDGLSDIEFEDGKGNIEKEEFAKLQEAAKTKGAVLRVSCKVKTLVTDSSSGGGNGTFQADGGARPKPGWGIGSFGNPDLTKVRGQEQDVPIGIPEVYKGQPVVAQTDFEWVTDILIDDILAVATDDGWVFVNINNGGAVTKMQVFLPGQELPQEIQDLLKYKDLLELLYQYDLDKIKDWLDSL